MTYDSEWDGFTTQAASGVAEALYTAGVDCSLHEGCERSEADTVDDRQRT